MPATATASSSTVFRCASPRATVLHCWGATAVGKTTLLLDHHRRDEAASWHRDLAGQQRRPQFATRIGGRGPASAGFRKNGSWAFPSLTIDEHLTVVARPGAVDSRIGFTSALSASRVRGGAISVTCFSGGEQQNAGDRPRTTWSIHRFSSSTSQWKVWRRSSCRTLVRVIETLTREEGLAIIIVEQVTRASPCRWPAEPMVLDRGIVVHRSTSEQLLADNATAVGSHPRAFISGAFRRRQVMERSDIVPSALCRRHDRPVGDFSDRALCRAAGDRRRRTSATPIENSAMRYRPHDRRAPRCRSTQGRCARDSLRQSRRRFRLPNGGDTHGHPVHAAPSGRRAEAEPSLSSWTMPRSTRW